MSTPVPLPAHAPAGRLAIGALRLRVHQGLGLAPAVAPMPEQIAAAIDDALRGAIDPADRTHWVVDTLRLRANAMSSDAAGIAEAIAGSLREAVRRVLRGEISEGVLRYPDRAAWLAALLWDHACGLARGHWAYARLRRLDALPLAMVPALAIEAEPDDALPALQHLAAQGRLSQVIARIGEDGARAAWPRLLQAAGVAAPGAEAPFARMFAAMAPRFPRSPHRAALAALIEASRLQPHDGLPGAAAVRRCIVAASAGRAVASAQAANAGLDTATTVPATAQGRSATAAEPHARTSPETQAGVREEAVEIPAIDTAHAGVFLLWRSVVEMRLERLLPESAPGAGRLALAAALTGPARAHAWRDPALHWLAGYTPAEGERPLAAPPDLALRFRAHLAEWHAPRMLQPTLRRCGRVHLLQDRDSEDWLAVGDARDCARAAKPLHAVPVAPLANARDPTGDIAYFGVAARRQARAWALLARAAHADLARRLGGLERASACWLADRLLGGCGRLVPGEPAVLLPHVPLDLVLRMAAIDGTEVRLDDGRAYRLRLPGAS